MSIRIEKTYDIKFPIMLCPIHPAPLINISSFNIDMVTYRIGSTIYYVRSNRRKGVPCLILGMLKLASDQNRFQSL